MTLYVDPGSKTGLAIYRGGPTPIVSLLDRPSPAEIRNHVVVLRNIGVTRVVIEDQHAPRIDTKDQRKRFNFKTLQRLVRTAWTWAVVAELEGLDVDWIAPSAWQGPSFKTVDRHGPDGEKLSTKQRSRAVMAATWGTVARYWPQHPTRPSHPDQAIAVETIKVPEHCCDAAVMGRWHRLHGGGR